MASAGATEHAEGWNTRECSDHKNLNAHVGEISAVTVS